MAGMLEVRGLTVRLPWEGEMAPVVNSIDFEIEKGEFVGLVGESGSGKSMTARSLIRLLPKGAVTEGSIRLGGRDVLSLSDRELRELRATKAAMIFQDPRAHVDPLWRVEDHMAEPLRLRDVGRDSIRERCRETLGAVGIADPDHCLRAYPDQLSGGMLQRVMIAGALVADPELLIADEPTTALDVTTQAEIMGILADLKRDRDLATLFITHDLELAAAICDRVLVMYAGMVIEVGRSAEVFARQLHPYTWGLLRARPSLTGPLGDLAVIPGRPVSGLEAVPEACPFAPRCAWAQEKCVAGLPPLLEVGAGRLSACIRIGEIADELS